MYLNYFLSLYIYVCLIGTCLLKNLKYQAYQLLQQPIFKFIINYNLFLSFFNIYIYIYNMLNIANQYLTYIT
jgi:hypothetical protein